MARLLRLLPDPASPHKPRSVDPSKIACVSLAAMANQAKPLRGVTPSRRSKVPSGGRGWFTNRVMAHVRTPGGPTSPTQRLFRDARSSPNLCARPSLTRSNRRGTGPVCPVVWRGGVARRPPILILGGPLPFPGHAGGQVPRAIPPLAPSPAIARGEQPLVSPNPTSPGEVRRQRSAPSRRSGDTHRGSVGSSKISNQPSAVSFPAPFS